MYKYSSTYGQNNKRTSFSVGFQDAAGTTEFVRLIYLLKMCFSEVNRKTKIALIRYTNTTLRTPHVAWLQCQSRCSIKGDKNSVFFFGTVSFVFRWFNLQVVHSGKKFSACFERKVQICFILFFNTM